MARSSELLALDPAAQLVLGANDDLLVRRGDHTIVLGGVPPALPRAILDAADGTRTLDQIVACLPDDYQSDDGRALVETLARLLLQPAAPAAASPDPRPAAPTAGATTRAVPITIVGNGPLAATIQEALRRGGFSACRLLLVRSFASCREPSFRSRQQEMVLAAPPRRPPAPAEPSTGPGVADDGLAVVSVGDLTERLKDEALVICALERVPYRAVLDVNRAALETGTPCLFVTVDGPTVVVGPTLVPFETACFACERLESLFGEYPERQVAAEALPMFATGGIDDADGSQRADLAQVVLGEAAALLSTPSRPTLLASALHLSAGGPPRSVPVLPADDCCECAAGRAARSGYDAADADTPLARRAMLEMGLAMERAASQLERGALPFTAETPRTIGILGGGTAGYLAALTLRARLPHVEVTLIESRRIPVIGVGEATTPRFVEFMHGPQNLGRDIVDFHRRVRPMWKVGVQYYWGLPGDYSFPWPFQYGNLLESMLYDGNLDAHCLGAVLMNAKRAPVIDNGDGSYTSLLDRVPIAYHLDNARLLQYLREEAEQAGVHLLDRGIVDAEVTPDGEEIAALVAEGGERFRFDLYVDCSGFRSFLLEQKLRSPYTSYERSLYTDSAVVANVPHGGVVKPYTLAESMDHGWCWNISFEDCDHRGYVFSSAFCSVEEAAAEMQAKNPGMGEWWSLKFRSGRHEHFWKGNVVALGNAYAFVEPLASTSLHMLMYELDLFTRYFPRSPRDAATRQALNGRLNRMWDNLRGWLAVQYRFNQKFDTPFWRECRASVDLAAAEERVALFQDRAPLFYHSGALLQDDFAGPFLPEYAADYFGQEYVYDVMLLGQQVPARYAAPSETRCQWARRANTHRAVARWALRPEQALALVREEREDLLLQIAGDGDGWIQNRRY